MKLSTILWTFYALSAHPFYVMLGFFIAHSHFSYYIETNVRWVNIPFFWGLLLLFLYLRFLLLKALIRWQKREFNPQELWLFFLKNHRWGMPTVALFVAFSLPVEGNIAGFFTFLMGYSCVLCSPLSSCTKICDWFFLKKKRLRFDALSYNIA